MGFRGKQIVTLTLVAGVVALATSLMNATSLARVAVVETGNRASFVAENLYHHASRVIRQPAERDLRAALAADPALRNSAEAAVGYSPTMLYVAITDEEGRAILHSDPEQQGMLLQPGEPFDTFAARSSLWQLWALTRGHRVLEVELPFSVDEQPFGAVRVAVSTLLLKEELAGAIARNALLAAGVVLAAFLASFYLANRLLAPIEILRRELARIDPGGGEPPLDLRNEADVSRVAEFFATMSRRLAESEERQRETGSSWLETMLGGLSDAVVVVSGERHVLSLNNPACLLLRRPRAELQGRALEEILPADHPITRIVDEALSRGEGIGPRSVPLEIEGREVVHTVSAQVLRESEHVSGVLVSARDMEKLSRLGSHLSYSQKLTALGRLTSGVAHEIKNPLNAMVIHVALLRQKLASAGPDAQSYLNVLEEEIRRLDRVIQGFLRFTRPEDLQLTAVALPALVQEVLRLISADAESHGIQIDARVPGSVPPVYGDPELLQQCLLNLAINACEAMPDGGILRVAAHRSADGSIVLKVSDTGIGIPPGELPKIFDLYYTTKSQGSGIGLSMVYRIVQLHGGDISVESQPGTGTRFTITLPEVPA